jgi:hypothetical protein
MEDQKFWQSRSWWQANLTSVVGLLLTLGVVGPEGAAVIESEALNLIDKLFEFALVAGPQIAYILGRARIRAAGK